jgi:hypothetical protein
MKTVMHTRELYVPHSMELQGDWILQYGFAVCSDSLLRAVHLVVVNPSVSTDQVGTDPIMKLGVCKLASRHVGEVASPASASLLMELEIPIDCQKIGVNKSTRGVVLSRLARFWACLVRWFGCGCEIGFISHVALRSPLPLTAGTVIGLYFIPGSDDRTISDVRRVSARLELELAL